MSSRLGCQDIAPLATDDMASGLGHHRDTVENTMNCNVGKIDKTVRIVGGIALIMLSLTGAIGAWGWIGIVPLATGFFSFCPAYRLLGLNTCQRKR